MPVQLNHTIALATDPEASATFLSEMLGLGTPRRYGAVPRGGARQRRDDRLPRLPVATRSSAIHYAFLVTEAEFDEIFGRIKERGLDYWADPHKQQPGEINTTTAGAASTGTHPDGHFLEILTVPYGGWPD